MEKLDLKYFRELKQEMIDILTKLEEVEEQGIEYPEEELQKQVDRYKEIVSRLSKYDLSDIDFEEWRGIQLVPQDKDTPLDFSKTKANLDFSIMGYVDIDFLCNFKNCKIKNFDFDNYYNPDMFDDEFKKENKEHFLSDEIPKEVAKRFYEHKITLKDIRNYPELSNKIGEKNLDIDLRYLYKLIGREEFYKLDAEFIDKTSYSWKDFLESTPNLRTAEEIMPVLYKNARDNIIMRRKYENPFDIIYNQNELGENFKKLNPDLFLSDDAPEDIKKEYYNNVLSLKKFSENLEFFENKKIVQALPYNKLVNLYGENIYQLFKDYKPIIDKIIDDPMTMLNIGFPREPITEEQRKEIMNTVISTYIMRNGFEKIQTWNEIKMILDFTSIEQLPVKPDTREIIEKYGLDMVIKSGLDMKYLFHDIKLTNLDEIANIDGIELEDIKKLVERESQRLLYNYDVKQLLEYGIKDLLELFETTNDLHKVKEMIKKRPLDLINMGIYQDVKKEFIERYGIDNIIELDEETNGMFSHQLWQKDIYLTMLAQADRSTPKLESNEQLTYEQFRDRIYEILLHARDKRGLLTSRDYQDYDFIQGKFRKEHSDIFIDGELPQNVKKAFYTRHMTAEMVRQNPELIKLLQGKDLSRVFDKEISAGIVGNITDKEGNVIGGLPNTVNMAKYLSEKLGQEEFLKICADYGKTLDSISLLIENNITVENVRETIDNSIYREIKERGIEYFEELPESFQEKHPELFLPKEIDEEIRKKFYTGKLSFDDIRHNPKLKEILQSKDINVGFYNIIGKGQIRKLTPNGSYMPVNRKFEILTKQEILDYAEKYGSYFEDVNDEIFVEGQTEKDRISEVQNKIEYNILNRSEMILNRFGTPRKVIHANSPFNENVPDFFKEKHPELFLDSNAPEELKNSFYDGGKITFKEIKEHPEWREFIQGKELSRAFTEEYSELFKKFDNATLMKLGTRYPETIEKMVQNHREETLENWYKSTGGKYVPHHVVMLNFPEGEIDSFLGNTKRWTQLMKLDRYNLNDDGKSAILKAAYTMGVFQGDDDGFNKTMKLFADVPQELTQEEHDKVDEMFKAIFNPFEFGNNIQQPIFWNESENSVLENSSNQPKGISDSLEDAMKKDLEMKELFESAYTLNDEGKYIFRFNKQKDKQKTQLVREILEKAEITKLLTPQKAHQIFDSFIMEYNPDFVKFFNENAEKIISNSEYIKDIATIQRQFKDITRINSGRRLTLEVAQDYIKSIVYTDIEVGNERVAEQAKIAGYSQKDFEAIQALYNEGETRDFSSIPRIQGETNGYTYEMLRCDDPLALTIGTLTNCCQEIHGAGQTSMEHSVVSPDGRVFCVKDSEGRLVAQSWFWRNQYTGCFDNIEIPNRVFQLYEKEHPDVGRKGLTKDVLEVYKKAAQDLMQEDARVYQELLENGTITQEQYDALLLGKITIGAGYNDIKFSLRDAHRRGEFGLDQSNEVLPKRTDRFSDLYDDAHYANDGEHDGQYIIAERDGTIKSEYENLYVHQDDVPVYDGTNMSSTVLLTMKRMDQSTQRDNLAYLSERSDEENLPKSQRIINNIAKEYGLDPNDTRVMATARIALIYSKGKDKIIIGDVLSSPLKKDLTEEQKQKATEHITYQLKKALKQIGVQDSEVDLSSLSEEQQHKLQSIMLEIEKENDKRGER